jgi:S1-C subfamily serine protease
MRIALVLIPLLALAGCGSSTKTSSTTKPAGDPLKSVVFVKAIYGDHEANATGVVFDAKRGLVLTANHAVENAPAIEVTLSDGTLKHGRPVARAQCHDLAVLKLTPLPLGAPAIKFGNSRSVRLDETVRTIYYALPTPGSTEAQLTNIRGSVSAVGVREQFPPLPAIEPLIAHQSPLTATASGSPLLSPSNEMIGVNTLVAHPREADSPPGVEYALTSNYIRRRLGELRPGKGGAFGGWQAEHNACHAALHKLIGAGHIHP